MLSNEITNNSQGSNNPTHFSEMEKIKRKKSCSQSLSFICRFFPFELKRFSKSFLKSLKTWWTYICHLVTMVTDTYSHTLIQVCISMQLEHTEYLCSFHMRMKKFCHTQQVGHFYGSKLKPYNNINTLFDNFLR